MKAIEFFSCVNMPELDMYGGNLAYEVDLMGPKGYKTTAKTASK